MTKERVNQPTQPQDRSGRFLPPRSLAPSLDCKLPHRLPLMLPVGGRAKWKSVTVWKFLNEYSLLCELCSMSGLIVAEEQSVCQPEI